jgi:hypothetical protein
MKNLAQITEIILKWPDFPVEEYCIVLDLPLTMLFFYL